jgi:hypothetical protein
VFYRVRQFWLTLVVTPAPDDLEQVRLMLSPEQFGLFTRLSPVDQAQSLKVFHFLIKSGEKHPDLILAALLHDTGKIFYPLRIWERMIIVVGNALFPSLIQNLGRKTRAENFKKALWRRPFVIAQHHPAWGAELVAKAGASPLAVALIKNHQNYIIRNILSEEEALLMKLQNADKNS